MRAHRCKSVMTLVATVAGSVALLPTPASAADDPRLEVHRLGGQDRYETAARLAQAAYPGGADEVVLASGEIFSDALAASFLAGQLDAPILLTQRNDLPEVTAAALDGLGAESVVVVGGTAAISDEVFDDVEEVVSDVERVGGRNRFATAAAAVTWSRGSADTVLIASGWSYADGVAAGPMAFDGLPLLLTPGEVLAPETRDALHELDPNDVIIIGGEAAVSDAVRSAIEDLGIDVDRIAGTTRQGTAAALADWAIDELEFSDSRVALARGDGFADALAAAPYAGVAPMALLLTESSESFGDATSTWLADHEHVLVSLDAIGGPGAVSESLLGTLRSGIVANGSSIEPYEDTTVVDGSLVVDSEATSTQGGKIILTDAAETPVVGGHLAVTASEHNPAGVLGRVENVSNSDDGTVVELSPAVVVDAFEDVDVRYNGPGTIGSKSWSALQSGHRGRKSTDITIASPSNSALTCTGIDAEELEVSLEIGIENLGVIANVSALDRYALVQVSGQLVLSGSLGRVRELARCSLDPLWATQHQLQVLIPTFVPVVLEVAPLLEFTIDAGTELSAGVRVYFTRGFEWSDGQARVIEAHSAEPEGELAGYVEATIFGGADFAMKIWDVAGVFLKLGPELTVRGALSTSGACVDVSAGLTATFGFRLDVWIARADLEAISASVSWDLYSKCFDENSETPESPSTPPAAREQQSIDMTSACRSEKGDSRAFAWNSNNGAYSWTCRVDLGGLDLQTWCAGLGTDGAAVRVGNGAADWRCEMTTSTRSTTTDVDTDLNVACAQQHGSGAVARFRSASDAFSWYCVRNGSSVGGIDVDGYCKGRGGRAVVLDRNSAFSWRCRVVTLTPVREQRSVDITAACRSQKGDGRAFAVAQSGRFDSWTCLVDLGGVDLNAWCKAQGPGGIAVLVENNASGWRCEISV